MLLADYIKQHHNGNKAAFARQQGVLPQTVTPWINAKWIVIDYKTYYRAHRINET